MGHRYGCSYRAVKSGMKSCLGFAGEELDEAIVKRVLGALSSPPVQMLKDALEEARRAEEARKRNIEAERQRLERRERLLRDQFEACSPKYHLLYNDLQEQLNQVLEEKQRFRHRLLIEQFRPKTDITEKEIEELCELAGEVPEIWNHPLVTDRERKEIIACLVQRVVVDSTPETIEVTLHWTSGTETSFKLYRRPGKYNLVKELHTQGCNTREILDRLERGETSTGQSMKLHVESLYKIYKRLGLKPHAKPSWYRPLQEEAVQLRERGWTCERMARLFNDRGLKSLSGRPWSWKLVFNLLSEVPKKPDPLEETHRQAFLDAERRGLNLAETARLFNDKGIPRHNGRPWHEVAVARR